MAQNTIAKDAKADARAAGLRYVTDAIPAYAGAVRPGVSNISTVKAG